MLNSKIPEDSVLMMVGLPASGKSTWIDKFVSEDNRDFSSVDVISTDDYINSVAYAKGITYDVAFKQHYSMANLWFNRNLDDLAKGGQFKYVIVDRTNLSKKGRANIIRKAKEQGLKVIAIVFPLPEEKEWERRLNSRPGKTISWSVLKDMRRNYQEPSDNEGFDDIIHIAQNTESLPIFA